jgi:hypothetical protein
VRDNIASQYLDQLPHLSKVQKSPKHFRTEGNKRKSKTEKNRNKKRPLCTATSAQCLRPSPPSSLPPSPMPCQRAHGCAGTDRPNGDSAATPPTGEEIRTSPSISPGRPRTLPLFPSLASPFLPSSDPVAERHRRRESPPPWPLASPRRLSVPRSFAGDCCFDWHRLEELGASASSSRRRLPPRSPPFFLVSGAVSALLNLQGPSVCR